MSRYVVKGKHFSTMHVWFENGPDKFTGGYDKLIVHANPTEEHVLFCKKCCCKQQETLISDLTLSEAELWSKTTKTVRNEINRAMRENVKIVIFQSKDITDEILNSFSVMYREMYEEKGMSSQSLPINELKTYAENSDLVVSVAYIENKPVVYHSYIKDLSHSRFLHSCSEFRVADNAMRNAIGRANKLLHWNDWIALKNLGIKEYDWGGISSFESPNGIDQFKMAFGGEYRKYYNLICDCSLLAKLYSSFRTMIKK